MSDNGDRPAPAGRLHPGYVWRARVVKSSIHRALLHPAPGTRCHSCRTRRESPAVVEMAVMSTGGWLAWWPVCYLCSGHRWTEGRLVWEWGQAPVLLPDRPWVGKPPVYGPARGW